MSSRSARSLQAIQRRWSLKKNYELFTAISLISKQAKQAENEIKELEDEIHELKKAKTGQKGIEKSALLNELKSKTQKLLNKQDKYENEYKKYSDEFKQYKNYIKNIFENLRIMRDLPNKMKLFFEGGVHENNIQLYLKEIENKVKTMHKIFESESGGKVEF